jgi:hypothetical protein
MLLQDNSITSGRLIQHRTNSPFLRNRVPAGPPFVEGNDARDVGTARTF